MKPLLPPPRVWRLREIHYKFVGGFCRRCGFKFFPFNVRCPRCGSTDVEKTPLPRRGVVEAYTMVYQVPEHMKQYAPLTYALVRLEDGTRVVAAITEAGTGFGVGCEVEAVFRRVVVDGEHGVIAYGTKFRPVRLARVHEEHHKGS